MDTNPQGSAKTVSDAANAFLGMMEPEEAQAQPEVQQELESEVVEDEYEAADSEQSDDYAEEEQEEPTPTYKVKVGKDELDVPLDELLKGYSRTADYTRKTQEIAETRKAVEAERAKIDEAARLRDTYAQRLQVIEQMLNQDSGEDLATLKETDPIGYAVKVAEQSEREKQLNAVRAEQQRLAQQQQAEQGERLKAHLATEAQKLAEAIPELSDPAKGQAIRTDIRNYAQKLGFSEQELAQVYDSRAVTALYKAMQYDKLVSNKGGASKKVNSAPRMLKPGTSTPETRTSQEVKNMRGRLKKSGRAKDAAALFERLL
jgi:Tfp pilus assembly protein PilN